MLYVVLEGVKIKDALYQSMTSFKAGEIKLVHEEQ